MQSDGLPEPQQGAGPQDGTAGREGAARHRIPGRPSSSPGFVSPNVARADTTSSGSAPGTSPTLQTEAKVFFTIQRLAPHLRSMQVRGARSWALGRRRRVPPPVGCQQPGASPRKA